MSIELHPRNNGDNDNVKKGEDALEEDREEDDAGKIRVLQWNVLSQGESETNLQEQKRQDPFELKHRD